MELRLRRKPLSVPVVKSSSSGSSPEFKYCMQPFDAAGEPLCDPEGFFVDAEGTASATFANLSGTVVGVRVLFADEFNVVFAGMGSFAGRDVASVPIRPRATVAHGDTLTVTAKLSVLSA